MGSGGISVEEFVRDQQVQSKQGTIGMSEEQSEKLYLNVLGVNRHVVAGLEQIITDANYWNGLPQAAGNTIDIEDYRLALHHARQGLSLWEGRQYEKSTEEWSRSKEHLKRVTCKQD